MDLLAASCASLLIDLHSDPDHHRSVLTLAGDAVEVQDAARSLARTAVEVLDLRTHLGAHPRLGVVDVVPFVPLGGGDPADLSPAVAARDAFGHWAGNTLSLPCFSYGPLADGTFRSLPEVRRGAWRTLLPDTGPRRPHPSAGACAVGARGVLVAYNLWVDGGDLALVRRVAASVRDRAVRALGFALTAGLQVSCNLLDPVSVGPADVYDAVAARLDGTGARVTRCELVGLIPAAALARIPMARWASLDLAEERTIEARLGTH